MKIMQIIRKKAYTNITAKYHYGDEKCKCLSCILILIWTMRGVLSLLGKFDLSTARVLIWLHFRSSYILFWPPDAKNWLIRKKPWCWEGLKTGEGDNRRWDGWMARPTGREFEEAPGVGDWQGSLACWSPWDGKESDMTEWLNWHSILSVFTQ